MPDDQNGEKQRLRDSLECLKEQFSTLSFALDLPKALITLYEVGNLHLLTQEEVFEEMQERRETGEDAKGSLGAYLCDEILKDVARPGGKVFIESGTTFAPASARLSRELSRIPDDSILTNNLLTLMSLGVGKVRVTEGTLVVNYLAFLDFVRARRKDLVTVCDWNREKDVVAFRRLNEKISEVDTIYMTSSDFGFLVGPVVGGRENAIFKYCLINCKRGRRVRLCISYDKLFVGTGQSVSCANHVYESCFTVMNLKRDLPEFDAPELPDYEVQANPSRRDEAVSAPMELGLTAQGQWCEGGGLRGLYSSWVDVLEHTPSGSIEVIVGIGKERGRLDALKRAVAQCNELLSVAGSQRMYALQDGTPDGVARFIVERS